MPNVRRKATPEELAEAGGSDVVRQKATPEEVAEATSTPAPAVEPDSKVSTGRAAAEGALQGGTYGFGDELQGVLGALLRRSPGAKALGYSPESMGEENIFEPSGYGDSFVGDYRKEREGARRDREKAEKDRPAAFNTAQIASAILTPGPKPGKGVVPFMKAGAKVGGAYGLGSSDADLTKGELFDAAVDTGAGATLGAATGAAGGAVNKYALQPLAQKATAAGQQAFQRGAAQANKPIDAAINSARGALGGEVAAGNRTLEVLRRLATDPSVPEDVSRGAADLLQTAEAKGLDERVARSTMGQFFQRLPRIEKAQEGFDAALEGGSPEARRAAVEAFMNKSPAKRAGGEILKRILPTLVGAGIGGAAGGTAGAGVGGTLGLLTGAMSGAPGRIVRNAVSSPQFQRSAAQLGERAAGEMLPGAAQGLIGEQAGNPKSTLREKLAPYLELLAEEK